MQSSTLSQSAGVPSLTSAAQDTNSSFETRTLGGGRDDLQAASEASDHALVEAHNANEQVANELSGQPFEGVDDAEEGIMEAENENWPPHFEIVLSEYDLQGDILHTPEAVASLYCSAGDVEELRQNHRFLARFQIPDEICFSQMQGAFVMLEQEPGKVPLLRRVIESKLVEDEGGNEVDFSLNLDDGQEVSIKQLSSKSWHEIPKEVVQAMCCEREWRVEHIEGVVKLSKESVVRTAMTLARHRVTCGTSRTIMTLLDGKFADVFQNEDVDVIECGWHGETNHLFQRINAVWRLPVTEDKFTPLLQSMLPYEGVGLQVHEAAVTAWSTHLKQQGAIASTESLGDPPNPSIEASANEATCHDVVGEHVDNSTNAGGNRSSTTAGWRVALLRLPPGVTTENFQAYVERWSPEDVYVPFPNAQGSSHAFVTFSTSDGAQRCIAEAPQHPFLGATIRAEISTSQPGNRAPARRPSTSQRDGKDQEKAPCIVPMVEDRSSPGPGKGRVATSATSVKDRGDKLEHGGSGKTSKGSDMKKEETVSQSNVHSKRSRSPSRVKLELQQEGMESIVKVKVETVESSGVKVDRDSKRNRVEHVKPGNAELYATAKSVDKVPSGEVVRRDGGTRPLGSERLNTPSGSRKESKRGRLDEGVAKQRIGDRPHSAEATSRERRRREGEDRGINDDGGITGSGGKRRRVSSDVAAESARDLSSKGSKGFTTRRHDPSPSVGTLEERIQVYLNDVMNLKNERFPNGVPAKELHYLCRIPEDILTTMRLKPFQFYRKYFIMDFAGNLIWDVLGKYKHGAAKIASRSPEFVAYESKLQSFLASQPGPVSFNEILKSCPPPPTLHDQIAPRSSFFEQRRNIFVVEQQGPHTHVVRLSNPLSGAVKLLGGNGTVSPLSLPSSDSNRSDVVGRMMIPTRLPRSLGRVCSSLEEVEIDYLVEVVQLLSTRISNSMMLGELKHVRPIPQSLMKTGGPVAFISARQHLFHLAFVNGCPEIRLKREVLIEFEQEGPMWLRDFILAKMQRKETASKLVELGRREMVEPERWSMEGSVEESRKDRGYNPHFGGGTNQCDMDRVHDLDCEVDDYDQRISAILEHHPNGLELKQIKAMCPIPTELMEYTNTGPLSFFTRRYDLYHVDKKNSIVRLRSEAKRGELAITGEDNTMFGEDDDVGNGDDGLELGGERGRGGMARLPPHVEEQCDKYERKIVAHLETKAPAGLLLGQVATQCPIPKPLLRHLGHPLAFFKQRPDVFHVSKDKRIRLVRRSWDGDNDLSGSPRGGQLGFSGTKRSVREREPSPFESEPGLTSNVDLENELKDYEERLVSWLSTKPDGCSTSHLKEKLPMPDHLVQFVGTMGTFYNQRRHIFFVDYQRHWIKLQPAATSRLSESLDVDGGLPGPSEFDMLLQSFKAKINDLIDSCNDRIEMGRVGSLVPLSLQSEVRAVGGVTRFLNTYFADDFWVYQDGPALCCSRKGG